MQLGSTVMECVKSLVNAERCQHCVLDAHVSVSTVSMNLKATCLKKFEIYYHFTLGHSIFISNSLCFEFECIVFQLI